MIVRQATEYLESAQPHILLVGFTRMQRVEYWEDSEAFWSIRPNSEHAAEWTERRTAVQQAVECLSNECNDTRRLYQAVKVVSGFSKLTKAMLIYTFAGPKRTPPLVNWLPQTEYLGVPYPKLDFAGDGAHPGPESTKWLATKTLTHLCSRLKLREPASDRLAAALQLDTSLLVEDRGARSIHTDVQLDGWRSPI